jgi:nucleotide-binding universal stress UspA family protein
MATLHSQDRIAAPKAKGAAQKPLRVLAVIDGSERAGRVIEQAIGLSSERRPLRAVLLAVVPDTPDGRLRGYGSFKREEVLARLIDTFGKRPITAAGRRLDQARLPHKDRIEVGDPVATILRVAREEGCDLIILGQRPPGRLGRWLPQAIGLAPATVAGQVVQRADAPVVVVK